MPDHDKQAIVDAYRAGIVNEDEAREALGFHDPASTVLAEQLAEKTLELQLAEHRLAEAQQQLQSAKDFARREFLRGFQQGRDGMTPPDDLVPASPSPTPSGPSGTTNRVRPKRGIVHVLSGNRYRLDDHGVTYIEKKV